MKKKLLSALLCTAMAASMLTGCGNSAPAEDAKTDAPAVEDAAAAEEGGEAAEAAALPEMTTDEIELTYMNFDNKVLTEYLAEKFMEKYPNIKVNVIYVPDRD